MRTFYLMTRVMGGEWKNYQLGGVTQQFGDLASALGMGAALRSEINEVMVGAIDTTVTVSPEGDKLITQTYSFVELC